MSSPASTVASPSTSVPIRSTRSTRASTGRHLHRHPGHEAFTAMRARGAKVTDIAILVVAADDGVMPQTIEALNHAGGRCPDRRRRQQDRRRGRQPEQVRQQLTEYNLVAEEYGGETMFVDVSAKQRLGIEDLLGPSCSRRMPRSTCGPTPNGTRAVSRSRQPRPRPWRHGDGPGPVRDAARRRRDRHRLGPRPRPGDAR